MRFVKLCVFFVAIGVFFQIQAYALQPEGPTGPESTAGAGNFPPGPLSPSMQSPPSGGPHGPMPTGDRPGPLYFAASAISPDGKAIYVAFDRYLMSYSLPDMKLVRKSDIGLPAVPMTPSISVSPDGKWIYVVQNGTLFQIEKENFKIKKSEKLHP